MRRRAAKRPAPRLNRLVFNCRTSLSHSQFADDIADEFHELGQDRIAQGTDDQDDDQPDQGEQGGQDGPSQGIHMDLFESHEQADAGPGIYDILRHGDERRFLGREQVAHQDHEGGAEDVGDQRVGAVVPDFAQPPLAFQYRRDGPVAENESGEKPDGGKQGKEQVELVGAVLIERKARDLPLEDRDDEK